MVLSGAAYPHQLFARLHAPTAVGLVIILVPYILLNLKGNFKHSLGITLAIAIPNRQDTPYLGIALTLPVLCISQTAYLILIWRAGNCASLARKRLVKNIVRRFGMAEERILYQCQPYWEETFNRGIKCSKLWRLGEKMEVDITKIDRLLRLFSLFRKVASSSQFEL